MKKFNPLLIPIFVILLTLFVHGHANETLSTLADVLVWAYLIFALTFSAIGFLSMGFVLIGLHVCEYNVESNVQENINKTSEKYKNVPMWRYWLVAFCVMSSFVYTEWTNAAVAYLICLLFITLSRVFTHYSKKYIEEELM